MHQELVSRADSESPAPDCLSDHAKQLVVVRINVRREISAVGESAPRFVLDEERMEFCSDGSVGVTS